MVSKWSLSFVLVFAFVTSVATSPLEAGARATQQISQHCLAFGASAIGQGPAKGSDATAQAELLAVADGPAARSPAPRRFLNAEVLLGSRSISIYFPAQLGSRAPPGLA